MDRRGFFARAGAAALFGGSGGALISLPRPARAGTTTVVEQFDWIASSRFLGEVVARALGFFEEEGIDLRIALGGPTNTGVASVASGSATLGLLSSSPTLMAARSGGIPIKCIAAGFQRHPLTFFSLAKNPIRTARDMRGKRIGIVKPGFNLVRALLSVNDIPEKDVQIVALGGDVAPLFSGQVDAISGWATDATKLKPLGPDRVALPLWDTGVKLYANPYYATDMMLGRHPELVAGFIAATARGWAAAREQPEQAIDHLIKAYPMLDRDAEMASVGVALSYVFTPETAASGWGAMKPDIWGGQIRVFQDIGQFDGGSVPTIDDVMTMAVLDATAAKRPRLG
jgi:NitT/TauT family transport system substrate-binding protein